MRDIITANLPAKFRQNIAEVYADAGEQWLAELPQIITEIADNWSLAVEPPFANLSFNWVALCVCVDGSQAVLKIGFPAADLANEADYLAAINGNGAVKLLRRDANNGALLLERAAPGETLKRFSVLDDARATEIAIAVMRRLRCKAAPDAKFPTLESWAEELRKAEQVGFELDFVKEARRLFDNLFAASKQKLLLHGDLHHENILSATREPFLAVDPKGIVGDLGYEIAVFLNNPRGYILSHPNRCEIAAARVAKFAASFEIEPRNLRQWAFAVAVLAAWWTFEDNGDDWQKWLACAQIWEDGGI